MVFPAIANDPFAPLVQPVEDAKDTANGMAITVIQIIMAMGILAGIYYLTRSNVSEGITIIILTASIGSILIAVLNNFV